MNEQQAHTILNSHQPLHTAGSTEPRLKEGVLGLGTVFIQGLTHMAPATAMLFTLPFISSKAGVTAPLGYLFAFLIILIMGITLTQLAKRFPSAGGYYTFISCTLGSKAGFLTTWIYFLADPTTAGFSLAFIGYVLQVSLQTMYGIYFPWWLFLLISGLLVSSASYRGLELSAKWVLILGGFEVVVVLLLSIWGILKPGYGGLNFSSFNLHNAPSIRGLSLAVIFSIFALAGWEGVAPLAEEVKNPKVNMPKAIIYSIIAMGFFLVFCSWGLISGWGTSNINELVASNENPAFILARHFWGKGWIIVLIALINSMLAVAITCNNSATRIWYSMARSGVLPAFLKKIHPVFKTPVNAVAVQTIVLFAVGLGLGWSIGPQLEFDFMGLVLTFSLIVVYSMGNLGVIRYYTGEGKSEFNFLLHIIFPIIGTTAMLMVGYASLSPWPGYPINYAVWVVLVWLIFGVTILFGLHLYNRITKTRKAKSNGINK